MDDEVRKLTQTDYEKLTEEACAGFVTSDDCESDEAELWLFVCQKVYGFLEMPLEFLPFEGATLAQQYLWNLQNLVYQRRATEFDTLEIPSRYIYRILEKSDCA